MSLILARQVEGCQPVDPQVGPSGCMDEGEAGVKNSSQTLFEMGKGDLMNDCGIMGEVKGEAECR